MATADKKSMWNYLVNAGCSKACAAGIMGNIEAESSFNLAAVGDGGTSFGLCQWHNDRGTAMKNFCASHGGNWESNQNGQLGYLMKELTTSYSSVWSKIKTQPNTDEGIFNASAYFVMKFEVAAGSGWDSGVPNKSNAVQAARYKNAKAIYSTYAGSTTSSSSSSTTTQTVSMGKAILSIAQKHVGEKEGSFDNDISYAGSSHLEWCAMFLKWCADQAKASLPGYNAYVPTWQSNSKGNNTWVDKNSVQSGDILFFNFSGGTTGVHVGILESRSGNSLTTIEGNTSDPNGSGKEGVFRKSRSLSQIVGGQRLSGTTTAPVNQSGSAANSTAASGVSYSIDYKTVTAEVKTSKILTADIEANDLRTRANNLLTTPTLVESPFIMLKIGDYTFGSYSIDGSYESINSSVIVNYPNYMTGIKITKVNGQVNQYQITMVYQIRNGDDPNLLDKIFSSVGYGKVYISYGDWNAPKFIYKEEEAIITKLNTNVDFANSRITYTLSCTSNALMLMANYYDEPAGTLKPSERIRQMIYDEESKYHLQQIFNGFANNKDFFWESVASDDVSVEVVAKRGIDPLSYINYLVTCMSPTTTSKNSPLRDANYYLTICEDKERGTYFTVKKVSSSEGIVSLNNTDVYEVDVGYPGDTLVTSFKINNDNSWSLLYNYSQDINTNDYIYNIDSEGNIYSTYSPGITTSNKYLKTTETQKSWWTQMTQFPVSATLTIKGLLRPAMLMSYVRINALFYGLRHVSSGLYIITKQVDTIDGNGYRTTLSLTRVAGDLDVIVTETKTVTRQIPVKTASYGNSSTYSGGSSSSSSSGNTSYSSSSSPQQVSSGGGTYTGVSGNFKPRLDSSGISESKWWGSQNIFTAAGYGMPNCTCYAYGRAAEIAGKFLSLPGNDAGNWYANATSFSRGKTPRLGAIAVWGKSNKGYAGHVAVVEEIKSNGDIVTSNSAYGSTYFYTDTYSASNGYAWKNSYRDYSFIGFIYHPSISSGSKVENKW